VTLHAPVEVIAKRVPPAAGTLEATGASSCLLKTGSHSWEAIAIHLLWLGVDFEVNEPPELIAYLAHLSERISAVVNSSGSKPPES
jgi:hypothetical protein